MTNDVLRSLTLEQAQLHGTYRGANIYGSAVAWTQASALRFLSFRLGDFTSVFKQRFTSANKKMLQKKPNTCVPNVLCPF